MRILPALVGCAGRGDGIGYGESGEKGDRGDCEAHCGRLDVEAGEGRRVVG